ncbi:cysteine hydrolase family protein [Chloroflexota bacterium]
MAKDLLKTLEEQVEPKHTALIIIDTQEDFCAGDGACARFGWDVSQIQDAVKQLSTLIHEAIEAGVAVIWVRTSFTIDRMRPNYIAMSGAGKMVSRKGELLILEEGSDGTRWYSEMSQPLPDEYIITKWHYDAFEDTNLDILLQSNGVRTLLFTGVLSNVCVEISARHGFIKGYYIVLVSDCTASFTQSEYDSAVFNIKSCFGTVCTGSELAKIWNHPE